MFTILCCADLHGEKVNLEITLNVVPVSVQDLVESLTRIFAREEAALQSSQLGAAADIPAFEIVSTFIYDDALLQWTKLKSITQLHEYDQLYVFQPQTRGHRDTQQDLPPPRPPVRTRARPTIVGSNGGGVPQHSSSYVDSTPVRGGNGGGGGLSQIDFAPSVSLQGGAASRRTPANFGASTLTDASRVASRSPLRSQVEEQRREEEQLSQRLSSVRSQRERLEREAQREEEETRRRQGAELDRLLQRKEQEIWSHRDALAKAEEEFQRLLAEKQQLMRAGSPL